MTILPCSSTPQVTGEACGPPSARVVITTAWCLGRMNSVSSARVTTVLVAIFLATSVYSSNSRSRGGSADPGDADDGVSSLGKQRDGLLPARPPAPRDHHAGRHQFQRAEEAGEVLDRVVVRTRDALGVGAKGAVRLLAVTAADGQHQAAARRERG